MWKVSTLLVVWLAVQMVATETIHFTNSAKHLLTTKNFTTYEVEVPGSRPITIIEANPEETARPSAVTIRYRNAAGESMEDHANVVTDDGTNGLKANQLKKTLYSPDLLNKFLKEYSQKLKNADSITRQQLNEITLINTNKQGEAKPSEEPEKEDQMLFGDVHERNGGNSKWYGDNRKTHPWNSKDGWVTMEAVPWSESKVSKWQSNTNKYNGIRNQNSYQTNPWSESESEEIMSRPRPSYAPTSPASNNYYGNDDDDYSDSPYSSSRPSYASEKPSKPAFDSFYNRRYRPSEDYNRKSSSPNSDHNGDSWYDHGFKKPYESKKPQHAQNEDIITDGRKPHFPQYNQNRPQQQYPSSTDRNHPQTYPESGNGEWVLISTTKGYQYPRRQGQRAITFSPQTLTHKSVKLTVLPMQNSMDMTTSHNGLIEVSSSTQTVEQAYKQQQHKHQQNKIATSLQPISPSTTTTVAPIRKRRVIPKFSLMRRDTMQDSSAVLAAVSAGMVPATLAVLAPMVLGRKRRSAEVEHPQEHKLAVPKV